MSKLRFGLFALACTGVVIAAAILAFGTKPASGGGRHHAPPVSKDVRQMLQEVSSRNIEQTIQLNIQSFALLKILNRPAIVSTLTLYQA